MKLNKKAIDNLKKEIKMNKQEAIEQVKNKALHHCGEKECYKDGCKKYVESDIAIDIINQIDEPQKVVIPKFVAEWIETCKNRNGILFFRNESTYYPRKNQ